MPQSSLRRADRVSVILERVSREGSVDAGALAEEFQVSPATIRRDLQMLEDQKLLARTHGGATAVDVAYELPVRYRVGHRREEKTLIAKRAAELLPYGPLTLGLSGGTTTHMLARLLAERVDLTVVTNALNIAAELALRPRLKLIMTGGVSRTQSYELVGPIAEQALAGLNMEIAVVGVDGISAQGGLTTHDEIEAHTDAAMIHRADKVMVVADGSKVGRKCLARICGLNDAKVLLVTDGTANPAEVMNIQRAGTDVVVVRP
ncbi:DeoR/GlpR family DNA-binding transcription regulator [Dactylosporangium sp. AC04546]|uniref:DeoR/GlpR family DNA-binding transcription regulator n=1 Tax=Dactylosporangium sp. AC04546 TaxID=2862460 RepID=UPI001EDE9E57|nr:DeoR/GlpR family DNA-binding transcription regulator [Dactylosporangium sp. AC04546]WVK83389.1 DeoR/GlpR family DNA-binding transcription regulator [Dactylosporangium sp. AC04546]